MALNHSPDVFAALPFRQGEKDTPHWEYCSDFVRQRHPSNFSTAVDTAFKTMADYHNTIVKVCSTNDSSLVTEHFIDKVLKEHCKLVAMAQAHLPLNDASIHRKFVFHWTDSLRDSHNVSPNSNLELLSCVYNIAAAYTHLAMLEAQHGTADSVRVGYNHFLHAAGYYQLTDELLARLPSDLIIKGDLRHDSLAMLIQLCMAQAHHCGYLRFAGDASKSEELRSRVASETARQYDDALIKLRNSIWFTSKGGEGVKEMEIFVHAMQKVFWARAHLHLGAKHEAEQAMGTAVGYYQRAKDYLAEVPKMNTTARIAWVNSIVTSVDDAHRAAVEANGSIFYSRVPTSLPTPDGLPRPLGQPTAVAERFVDFTSRRGADPFFGITPLHISAVVRKWREAQRQRVRGCVHAAEANRATVRAKLEDLGVSAVVSAASGEVQHRGRVPEPLRSRILQLQVEARAAQHGDTNVALVHYDRVATELRSVLESAFAEVEAELGKERALDEPHVVSYGVKMWRAAFPESSAMSDHQYITEALAKQRAEMQTHMVAVHAAAKSRLDGQLRDVSRLSWPITDLDALMPFAETIEAQEQSNKVGAITERLREVLASFDRLSTAQGGREKALSEMLESESVTFELSAADASLQEGILTAAARQFTDAMEEVNALTREIGELVGVASGALEELGVLESADPQGKEANEVVNKLEMAVEVYRECLRDLQQVCTFTEMAVERANALVVSARSFLLCRQLQAEEVMALLDKQIAQKVAEMEMSRVAVESSQQRQNELRVQISQMEENQRIMQQQQRQPLQQPLQAPQQQQPSSAYSMPGLYNAAAPPQMQPQQQLSPYQTQGMANVMPQPLQQQQQQQQLNLSTYSSTNPSQYPSAYSLSGSAPQQQQQPSSAYSMSGLYNAAAPPQMQPQQQLSPYQMQGMANVMPQPLQQQQQQQQLNLSTYSSTNASAGSPYACNYNNGLPNN